MENNTSPGTTKSSDPTDHRRPNIITPGILLFLSLLLVY
jgi:hypothetical protein